MSDEGKLPAVGVSVTMNLGDNRQIVLQTFFPQEAPLAEKNKVADMLLRVGDRQKARYEIVDLRKELDQHITALARFEDDLASVEERHEKEVAKKNIELLEINEAVANETKSGYEDHVRSGRRDAYTPRGHRAANIDKLNSDVKRVAEEKHKLEAERNQAMQGIQKSIIRYKEEIAKYQARIEECTLLIEGAANED